MAAPLHASPTPGWNRYSTGTEALGATRRAVAYGADVPSEETLRLLGNVEGKRILDLGCGTGANAVLLAEQGAKVIALDAATANVGVARERAEAHEVRVELHQGNLAELAFLRSDTVDAALSVMALTEVEDLARVFRQVHRVLKPEAPFVLSFPHPAFALFAPAADDPLRAVRPYDHAEPTTRTLRPELTVTDHPRTIGEIFTTLHRASFGVDQLLEPVADPAAGALPSADLARFVPSTVVFRARKQGN